jgi:choline-glycine betaine transporter
MSTQRIVGIVLLVVGIVLVVTGMNSSHSMVDQVSNTATGRFTDKTQWYIVGGIAMAVVGGLLTFLGSGKSTAK